MDDHDKIKLDAEIKRDVEIIVEAWRATDSSSKREKLTEFEKAKYLSDASRHAIKLTDQMNRHGFDGYFLSHILEFLSSYPYVFFKSGTDLAEKCEEDCWHAIARIQRIPDTLELQR